MRLIASTFIVTVLFGLIACEKGQQAMKTEPLPNQGGESPYCVVFDIAPAEAPGLANTTTAWVATYSSGGRTARFRIELTLTKRIPSETKGIPDMSFGAGRFVALPGSDASVLLRHLRKTLEAKHLPTKVARVATLPFEFVVLGEHQSHSADGGFSTQPKGDWTPTKIFLAAPGNDEGEVFLNFNPVLKKGEFSIKDADYGDIVLKELAKVL